MIVQSRGIVFQQFKYSDTSLIIKIFTEELGMRSYMVKGVRSKKAKLKPSLFEPLTLLDMQVYDKPNQNLHHIKEARVAYQWHHIPFSIEKQSVLLFLDEILYKTIREESPNKELFQWIFHQLNWFDLEEKHFINFHLFFMLQLTRFLGFYPKNEFFENTSGLVFDMQEGHFSKHKPFHPYFIEKATAQHLWRLLQSSPDTLKDFQISNTERRLLLDMLVSYFRLHLPELGKIKSLEILRMMAG